MSDTMYYSNTGNVNRQEAKQYELSFAEIQDRVKITFDHAMSYGKLGLEIFPLKYGTKEPEGSLCPKGLYNATSNLDHIERYFGKTALYGIGLRIPIGCIAIDIDHANKFDPNIDALKDVMREYDDSVCPVIKTRSKGACFFFRIPDELQDYLRVSL